MQVSDHLERAKPPAPSRAAASPVHDDDLNPRLRSMYERGKRVQSARRSSAEGPGPKRSSTLPPTLLQSDLEYTFKPQLVTSAARGEPPRSSVAVFDRLAPPDLR